jgi:hypothetical protein
MLIRDVTCAGSQKSHKVDFNHYNCRFTVQKGGVIDLEKVEPINKNRKVGDVNAMASALLARSQYQKLPTPELKPKPKKADTKKAEGKEASGKKEANQDPPANAKAELGKDNKESGKK